MTATSTEQRTPSSYAFLNRPFLRWKGGKRGGERERDRGAHLEEGDGSVALVLGSG
jgi:hypothetical protein